MGRAVWSGVVLLVAIGVTAAAGRATFPADLATRLDPVRGRLLGALDRDDPLAAQRPAELARFDSPFAAHPALTLAHVLPGGLFLALAPLQFWSRLRARRPQLHRWSGRLLVLAALVSTLPALYFGLLMPYGGGVEAVAIALFGGLFLASLARAVVAIRRGQAERHREWMIRAFAIAIGISTVRIVGAALDLALAPSGVHPRNIFVMSVWTGWLVTVAAAELWIAYTRPRSPSMEGTAHSLRDEFAR